MQPSRQVERHRLPSDTCRCDSGHGGQTRPATVAPAGSNRSSRGGNEAAEAFDVEGGRGAAGS
jgi:hypothetical protein